MGDDERCRGFRLQKRREIGSAAAHVVRVGLQVEESPGRLVFFATGEIDHGALPRGIDEDERMGRRSVDAPDLRDVDASLGELCEQPVTPGVQPDRRKQYNFVTRGGERHRRIRASTAKANAARKAVEMGARAQRLGEPHHLVARHRAQHQDSSQLVVSENAITLVPASASGSATATMHRRG